MNITDMTNLFVGYNATENFRVLICAQDEAEAMNIARSYGIDTHLENDWEITEFTNLNTKFDCDYVLTYADDSL